MYIKLYSHLPGANKLKDSIVSDGDLASMGTEYLQTKGGEYI